LANATAIPLNVTDKTEEQVLATYIARLRTKRVQQMAIAEELLQKGEYERRYELTKVLLDEMFKTIRKAQRTLEKVDMAAHPAIPMDNATLLNAVLTVWENTAFLTDLVLRLPDIVHLQVDRHPVRPAVAKWALETCLKSPVYADDVLAKPLRLALQELDLVPRDPSYINPYRGLDTAIQPPPPRQRPRLPRGPRLSDNREL
jgi:hypothetical protein